ncbi:hypothetical protein K456DRAFT_177443 [Colletotrichum gloeosporioides 23]|nr:hypothetical protein K456DRAFT_177443 [Colletotrichum gloeosporioides 23]
MHIHLPIAAIKTVDVLIKLSRVAFVRVHGMPVPQLRTSLEIFTYAVRRTIPEQASLLLYQNRSLKRGLLQRRPLVTHAVQAEMGCCTLASRPTETVIPLGNLMAVDLPSLAKSGTRVFAMRCQRRKSPQWSVRGRSQAPTSVQLFLDGSFLREATAVVAFLTYHSRLSVSVSSSTTSTASSRLVIRVWPNVVSAEFKTSYGMISCTPFVALFPSYSSIAKLDAEYREENTLCAPNITENASRASED